MHKFNIDCYCVVLTTDMPNNKRYILSLEKETISLPKVIATSELISHTNKVLIEYLKNMNISQSDLSLIPQIICLHSSHIEEKEDTINTVYGFLVDFNKEIKDSYWVSFEYAEPNKYSNLIMDVVQKL